MKDNQYQKINETKHAVEHSPDETSLELFEPTRGELLRLQIDIQKNELKIQRLIAKVVLSMSTLSLIALFVFAGYSLHINKAEDAKNMLFAAMNVTTHLTTAVIAYYFGAKKDK